MFARILNKARPFGRRTMATTAEAHDAEHAAITRTWKKRTMIAIPVVGAVAVMNVFIHMSHGHHEHTGPHYTYQRKLAKKVRLATNWARRLIGRSDELTADAFFHPQYPWTPHECNLFDYE